MESRQGGGRRRITTGRKSILLLEDGGKPLVQFFPTHLALETPGKLAGPRQKNEGRDRFHPQFPRHAARLSDRKGELMPLFEARDILGCALVKGANDEKTPGFVLLVDAFQEGSRITALPSEMGADIDKERSAPQILRGVGDAVEVGEGKRGGAGGQSRDGMQKKEQQEKKTGRFHGDSP